MSRAALKSKKLIVTAVLLLAAAALTGFVVLSNNSDTSQQSANTETTTQQSTPSAEVKTQTVAYEGQDGKTALELLKASYQVETQDSSYGAFVVSINGEQGNGPKYWAFYVDGTLAQVGAGDYQTKTGERIEWKLE